ncbi:MAG: hypothetical protein Q4G49_09415 [Paracoccus sp. (in: a-proteobacteria)]|nr:hypothetical protein [Paracoccus sp. (in: a-proteobacteria)]
MPQTAVISRQSSPVPRRHLWRRGLAVTILGTAGLLLAVLFFTLRGSGVNGTAGAALAILGALTTALGPLLAATLPPGGWRGFVQILTVLAALLSAIAGYFLMQSIYTAVMALATVAAVVLMLTGGNRP